MKIVIDIDEELYKNSIVERYHAEMGVGKSLLYALLKAIRNGTPLPKGHGRLIDADALLLNPDNLKDMVFRRETICFAPTIIEAERGEE